MFKRITSTLALGAIIFSASAQENDKQQEFGIGFHSLNSFAITYKIGKANSMWRINTFVTNANHNEETSVDRNTKQTNFQVGARFGKEFRKKVKDNFELRYGADLYFGYNSSQSETENKTTQQVLTSESYNISPGVNAVLGFNYIIGKNLILGAELMPGFTYSTGKRKTSDSVEKKTFDTSKFDFSLKNTSALVTLAYRL